MPKYSAPALEKGLDILETLAGSPQPLLLSELAQRMRRSPSELFRMADCLERRRYVTRDPVNGSFGLTLKLYELAHTHSPVKRLTRAAQAPLMELSRKTGESCHLSVLSGDQLLVLAQAESAQPVRLSVEVGGRFPPLQTVSGRLLLAQLPEAELAPWLSPLPSRERRSMLARIGDIRRRGVSLAENETIVGVHDAAVLTGNAQAGISAAVTLTALASKGARNVAAAHLGALKRCARQISQAVGLTPQP